MFRLLVFFIWIFLPLHATPLAYDIVIYGGSSAGVIAAVKASQEGKSVLLIEPSGHLGGMTSSGLGWVDAGNPDTVGGLTKKFFNQIWHYYQADTAWKWEAKYLLKNQHQVGNKQSTDKCMWVFEPHVAENIFNQMASQDNITVIFNEHLNRDHGVIKDRLKIVSIEMESGRSFFGKFFIDATYEGDLMAAAGVSFRVGREANAQYNETMNGIHLNTLRSDLPRKIDPYFIKGNPSSGLLPRVYADVNSIEGQNDDKIQAYNYRMCLTDVLENRVQIQKPVDYNEQDYELFFRYIEAAHPKKRFFKLDLLPNRKTDSNNYGPISTDFVGANWDYVEADAITRKQIAKKHENWQRGLIWTLQNHPRIPEKIRTFYAPWGLSKDEFTDNDHWPYQLYVREARRMIAEVVITEQIALGVTKHPDSIGLGSYPIDSHAVKYTIGSDGYLMLEGCVFCRLPSPYPISYRAIIPRRDECTNLLVPICLSASHTAYGSVRMEPVFMILGQSAATAACLAIDLDVTIQEVPYKLLRQALLNDQQVID